MSELASPSAVAVIETPESFVMEGRPANPGQLAHAGKLQFFGGHVEPGEDPYDTIRRELGEELNFRFIGPLQLLWQGVYDKSQNRAGVVMPRHVSLYRVTVDSAAELDLQVKGSIEEVPNTITVVKENEQRMTPFAFEALIQLLRKRE